MTASVNGTNGNVLVGMLLLEHQQQLVKEGGANRDLAHEVGVAAKKVETVYTQLDKNARELERNMSYVNVALSAYSTGKSIKAIGSTDGKSAAQQHAEYNKAANEHKAGGKAEIWDGAVAYAKDRAESVDNGNRKWAESMEKIREGSDKLGEKLGEQAEKEQELSNEMFKLAGALSRIG